MVSAHPGRLTNERSTHAHNPNFHFGRTWPYRLWNGPGLADRDLELGDDQEALQAAEQIREHGGCVTRIERRGDDSRWWTVWTVEPQYPWGQNRAA